MGASPIFGFLCPSGISLFTQFKKGEMKKSLDCKKSRAQFIVDILNDYAVKGKVFIAPYNAGFHWILSVIDPYNNTVYYLDSLCEDGTTGTKRDIISDLQDIVNTTFQIVNFQNTTKNRLMK